MPRARLKLQIPLRNPLAHILLLLFGYQPIAEIADIDFLAVELARIRLQICLHIVKQLLDLDLVGLEADFRPVAETEIDGGPLAGGLRHHWLESSPIADDLIEPLSFDAISAGTIFFNA